jgi:hypothetical protein
MQRKFLVIVLILFVLSVLIIGSLRWLSCKITITESNLIQLEKSKLIDSWLVTATGNIGRISEKAITITKDKEILDIIIKDNARIFSFSQLRTDIDLTQEDKQEEISLNDLKIGDYVTVLAVVNSEGILETSNITVFK